MKEIKFNCKVITPMFMAGADGKTPELRPSEFKGMMRFWWRAVMAEDAVEKLKETEASIFGGTGENEVKSKISLKISYDSKKLEKSIVENLKNVIEGKDAGISYLLYSTVLPRRERPFIKDDFEFYIAISSFDRDALKKAVASFWLATYLGGFGTRARKGGGNIAIEAVDGIDNFVDLDFIIKGKDSKEISSWIRENFDKTTAIIRKNKPENFSTSYSNLSFSRFIISSKGHNTWVDALNEIGEVYKKFRVENKKYIFDVAAFGLPIVHSDSTKIEGSSTERRSSPLIFKILFCSGQYFWLALRLTGEFLLEGEVLALKEQQNRNIKKTQKPDYRLIDEFWSKLKEKGKENILCTPKILDNMVEKIKELNPNKIILFGSRARGDAHKKADIDIAVDTIENIETLNLIGNIDLVKLEKVKNKTLQDKIAREGITLYERKG